MRRLRSAAVLPSHRETHDSAGGAVLSAVCRPGFWNTSTGLTLSSSSTWCAYRGGPSPNILPIRRTTLTAPRPNTFSQSPAAKEASPVLADFLEDEELARSYLSGTYTFDLLPCLPDDLSAKDAAFVLGISPDTLVRLVEAEGLPCVRLGPSLKIPKKDFLDWIFSRFLCLQPLNLDRNSGLNTPEIPQIPPPGKNHVKMPFFIIILRHFSSF